MYARVIIKKVYKLKIFGKHILHLLLLATTMTGCSEDNALLQETEEEKPVAVTIAFAVTSSTNTQTRMSSEVVQDNEQYRGIELQNIIPFAVEGKITATDTPKLFPILGGGEKPVTERPYYYFNSCTLMSGVASFLSYGRAPRLISENKAANGSLIETFPRTMAPKDIHFELESISQKVAHDVATSLANYMTAIAMAEGNGIAWKDAPNNTLKVMYLNFLNLTEVEASGNILPGASANIKSHTQALKNALNSLSLTGDDAAIRTAIIEKIDEYDQQWDSFPESIGLPDGAAVIRWNGERFVPEVSNTALADINGIDRIAYPAELYYYGNSRINTSSVDNRKTSYTDQDWSSVLATYEYHNGVVKASTKAVALIEPLQYGVACMKINLIKTPEENLTDAKGNEIAVGTYNFPLTGIIVGGQLPVGFDFAPTTSYPDYSEADMKYIYDNQLPELYLSASADAAQKTNTLVLQTYDKKRIPVLLEFINNSGTNFEGVDGIIYNGTKFYLAVQIDPGTSDRVFTQDCTTTLNLRVTGLSKAYNVVPNLLSPRLELGVELVTKWVSTTPEEMVL